jgi:hypothetical protein
MDKSTSLIVLSISVIPALVGLYCAMKEKGFFDEQAKKTFSNPSSSRVGYA